MARNSRITARMSPSLSLETPGMKDPHAVQPWPSFTLPGCLQYPLEVSRDSLQLAHQLAPKLLRPLPYRVLIVPWIARLPTRKQGTAMSLWY